MGWQVIAAEKEEFKAILNFLFKKEAFQFIKTSDQFTQFEVKGIVENHPNDGWLPVPRIQIDVITYDFDDTDNLVEDERIIQYLEITEENKKKIETGLEDAIENLPSSNAKLGPQILEEKLP